MSKIPYDENPAYAEERRINRYVEQCGRPLANGGRKVAGLVIDPPDYEHIDDIPPGLTDNTGF